MKLKPIVLALALALAGCAPGPVIEYYDYDPATGAYIRVPGERVV